jgi:hypothetical protein
MMALVAAFAIFFETVSWLKGGFGNLAYFCLFTFILCIGIFLPQHPWLDVIGINLVGSNMRAAAQAAFPAYDDSFVLAMISGKPLETFVWSGMRLDDGSDPSTAVVDSVSIGVVFSSSLSLIVSIRPIVQVQTSPELLPLRPPSVHGRADHAGPGVESLSAYDVFPRRLFHINFLRLIWSECLLLTKGLKWYWLAGMAVFWMGSVVIPSAGMRNYWFMLVAIWPVLVWSKMGEREVHYHTEHLIYQAAYPLVRLLCSSWVAGVLMTAVALSGVLLGRIIHAEPVALLSWILSVFFVPTLALTLGVWSRGSKLFEVVYAILWYLALSIRKTDWRSSIILAFMRSGGQYLPTVGSGVHFGAAGFCLSWASATDGCLKD